MENPERILKKGDEAANLQWLVHSKQSVAGCEEERAGRLDIFSGRRCRTSPSRLMKGTMNPRIVSTAPIDSIAIEILQQVAPVEISPATAEETVTRLLKNTIGLVVRGEGVLTRKMIESASDLRVIGRTGAGYDSIDVPAATERGIPLVFAPVGGFAVAEGALALLLALVKLLPQCDRIVKSGRWQTRYQLQTGDLAEHRLGIIGVGRIGSHLARLALPFGMKVLGHDAYVEPERLRSIGVEPVGLDELLAASDYVSIHINLTDENRGLIDADRVSRMKRGAILINTSRGGVVESLDILADALESGQLSAVGLDVFPSEPPDASHRIFRHERCLCAPHLIGVSRLAMQRIYRSMATDMVAVLQGQQPVHCVNPEVFS